MLSYFSLDAMEDDNDFKERTATMLKLKIFLCGFMCVSMYAMETFDRPNFEDWRSIKLKTLLWEAEQSTCNTYNREIKALKKAFVTKYVEKYDDQQAILTDLSRETNGAVRATADAELAARDSRKFLCIDPLQCTANEIDARWKRIHHEDCKNMKPKTDEIDARWRCIYHDDCENTSKQKGQEVKGYRGPLHDIPGMLPPS